MIEGISVGGLGGLGGLGGGEGGGAGGDALAAGWQAALAAAGSPGGAPGASPGASPVPNPIKGLEALVGKDKALRFEPKEDGPGGRYTFESPGQKGSVLDRIFDSVVDSVQGKINDIRVSSLVGTKTQLVAAIKQLTSGG